MTNKYIWVVIEDEHGIVSAWNTKEEALEELNRVYIAEDPELMSYEEFNDGNTIIWEHDDMLVTIQREPIGESFGWI